MRARLFCRFGDLKGHEYVLENEAVIGRDEKNPIYLPHRSISGEHAVIRYDEEARSWVLEDLDSRNGTWLDGIRVERCERLGPLHVIRFAGNHTFFFQDEHAFDLKPSGDVPVAGVGTETQQHAVITPGFDLRSLDEGKADQTVIGMPAVQIPDLDADEPAPSDPVWRIAVETGAGTVTAELVPGPQVLGRSASVDITIDNGELSRRHACLTLSESGLVIEDLGSTNKTVVNDRVITEKTLIGPEDRLSFGTLSARITREEPS